MTPGSGPFLGGGCLVFHAPSNTPAAGAHSYFAPGGGTSYVALTDNQSAVDIMGDALLRVIAMSS
jgi:hypothetical protein